MCLILFSFQPGARYPLVVAANRDEFYARPARPAHYWTDNSNIFAGRDESAGGSWLGITRNRRFAALTNFSAGDPARDYPVSRGALVADFLNSEIAAADYAATLELASYAGFNLLVFDGAELHYINNKGFPNQQVTPGTWGLSNAELTAPWPKCVDGASAMAALDPDSASVSQLLGILGNSTPPADNRLPNRRFNTEMTLETRRAFAARFIAGDAYGTRAMTVIRMDNQVADVFEQQIGPEGVRGSAVYARVPQTYP